MITSTKNPKIKWIRSLQTNARTRRDEGKFIVEGFRLVEEALMGNWPVDFGIFTDDINERGKAILAELERRGIVLEKVSPHVMRSASDTQTPQGILLVLKMIPRRLPENLEFVLIPDAVRDPGNLGTMLRTAVAAGVQVVLLPPDTTDPFAPKVLRAAMGAQFRLPVVKMNWDDIGTKLHGAGLHIFLADVAVGEDYTYADFCQPLALIIGGEAEGAGQNARSLADSVIHIPMPGGSESLNAAVASGILLFEIVRQRRRA